MGEFGESGMRVLSSVCAAALLAVGASGVAMADAPDLSVTLRPAVPNAQRLIERIDVEVVVQGLQVEAGQPLLRLPLVSSNVQGVADALEHLSVSDAEGQLILTARDEATNPMTSYRRWSADRAISGDVTVRYRVPVTNAPNMRGAAPPFEMRTEDGGVSGLGEMFIILPEGEATYDLRVRWALEALKPGVVGLSSFGAGDIAVDDVKASRLGEAFFMVGELGLYPDPTPGDGFFAAWQGQPPFDPTRAMGWSAGLYEDYLKFFREPGHPPYGVFLRRNLVNPGGGVELNRSFVATFGDKTDVEDLKLTLAHEMLHTFAGSLDAPRGLESSWWSEGLATYYQRILPYRTGHISAEDFLKDLNTTAARYYTNALSDTLNAEIPARFWADTRVRVLPYDRGAMYFAVLDEQIRAASRGRRSLDDLLLAAVEYRRQGQAVTHDYWVDLLRAELGEAGPQGLEAMLNGALMLPGSSAFGACFERTTAPLRRYELGFEPAALTESPRLVRGLIAGSAAEAAGVRDGDEIMKPVGQDGLQGDQTGLLTLSLKRGDAVFEITYLPRGETVDAWQWKALASENCR
jgi:predicted metalloprotease with PDZ domain